MSDISVSHTGDGFSHTSGAEVNLTFHMKGSGPPVLFLHGTSANHAVWQLVADALAGHATVICVDQRGHGRSDKPATGYTGLAFVHDIVTMLDALDIKQVVLVGHSLGARNAWLAASFWPDRIAGVIAIDYVPYVETPVLDALEARVAGGNQAFTDVTQLESYLQTRYPRLPADAVSRRAQWGYTNRADGSVVPLAPPDALQQVVDGLRTPWDQEFADVTVPMSCIRGVDSRIVSEDAWDMARTVRPDIRWVLAEYSDHYVPEEQPHVISEEINTMLTLLEQNERI